MAVAIHLHSRTFRRGVNDIPLRHLTGATLYLSYLRTSAARPLCMPLVPLVRSMILLRVKAYSLVILQTPLLGLCGC
jgi:hypothetical protein